MLHYIIICSLKKEGTCIYETLVATHPIKMHYEQKVLLVYSSEAFECT
jgi:hypothetical protein